MIARDSTCSIISVVTEVAAGLKPCSKASVRWTSIWIGVRRRSTVSGKLTIGRHCLLRDCRTKVEPVVKHQINRTVRQAISVTGYMASRTSAIAMTLSMAAAVLSMNTIFETGGSKSLFGAHLVALGIFAVGGLIAVRSMKRHNASFAVLSPEGSSLDRLTWPWR